MKNIILIVGCHRSGTSFLSRSLSVVGGELPKSTQEGAEDNPDGHFESLKIVKLHDEILNKLGLSWSSIQNVPNSWFNSDECLLYSSLLAEIIQSDYQKKSLIIVKDPRASRFIPLWKILSEREGYKLNIVWALRNPLDVARSLERRNGLPEAYGIWLWTSYTCAIIKSDCLDNAMLFNYPSWTDDVFSKLEEMENIFELVFPNKTTENVDEIKQNFKDEYVHSRETGKDNELYPLAYRLYDLLVTEGSKSEIEHCKDSFEASMVHYNRALMTSGIRLERFTGYFEENNAKKFSGLKEAIQEIVELEVSNRQLSRDIKNEVLLRNKIEMEGRKELKDMKKQMSNLEAILSKRETRLQESEDLLEDLNYKVASLERELEGYKEKEASLFLHLKKGDSALFISVYRRLYSLGGLILRRLLPDAWVDSIGRKLPWPQHPLERVISNNNSSQFQNISLDGFKLDSSKKVIFIFAIIGWDFRTQRPQHLARELSEDGWSVFYVEMEQEESFELIEIKDNLYRVRLGRAAIGHIQPYTGTASNKVKRRWLGEFLSFASRLGAGQKEVVVQHPYWWQFAELLSPEFRITFDCMDDIAGFDNTTSQLIEWENQLLLKCENLVVSSQYLFDKYKGRKTPVLIRNAGQIEHFERDGVGYVEPTLLKEKKSKVSAKFHVGYVGAISNWFDWKLIQEVAKERSDVFFHIAGAVTNEDVFKLNNLDNVHLYGEIPYATVPDFVASMDVVCIPFKIIPIIEACDPVKFYEYCGVGKPCVSTPLPELARVKDIVYFASNPQEFSKQLDTAIQDGKNFNKVEKLREFAQSNTWNSRAHSFANVVGGGYPKVSVVVLSYGDSEITLATLDSLIGKKTYPNMELIVVDNGSGESVQDAIDEYLKRYEDSFDCLFIKNTENLGFAEGNNVGIRSASGEYVLLLNNDTYVAPGAIFAMVMHLQNDVQIGAVGPLTNNIGNEAKVFVEYASMDEMYDVSRKVVSGYRGINTEIDTLAYFAVMFRRRDLSDFGYLDTSYGRGMFEDDDHCMVIKSKGYRLALAEDAFVHHHLSATFSKLGAEREALLERNRKIYEEKWGKWTPHKYRSNRPNSRLGDS
ncbi:glycosyltransferase [Lacimicrobium sp. SS2-24]|uniref:glycosyltransferase n=1 Tax=Lacimicrobium sp. SS2-24 TaxID=2005569 RepID=UPI000B4BB333|nr:glycosyltransferase [Lacimicrobium sp. SS2-24]